MFWAYVTWRVVADRLSGRRCDPLPTWIRAVLFVLMSFILLGTSLWLWRNAAALVLPDLPTLVECVWG